MSGREISIGEFMMILNNFWILEHLRGQNSQMKYTQPACSYDVLIGYVDDTHNSWIHKKTLFFFSAIW